MHPAQLMKVAKHPAVIWFDRIAPVACLGLAIYFALHESYYAAGMWFSTAVVGVALSVCNITKLMQKVLTKVVARRGN